MQDLIDIWKNGKGAMKTTATPEAIIAQAKQNKKQVLYTHYGTVIILTVTLIGLAVFFNRISFTQRTSKLGIFLMESMLAVRIVMEIFSIVLSKRIRMTNDAHQVTQVALSFYRFRRTLHGRVTLAVVASYVIGFYLLTPEFSLHIPLQWMIAMHVSFIAAGVFLVWVIRKGVRKEMLHLEYLAGLRKDISE
jgi:di/tricarboxylate transporter